MSQVCEIKCPHCGQWTLWKGDVDDRCLYCDSFLEPQRFSREIEKKIVTQVKKENDYFALKPTDGRIKREVKIFFNSFRWLIYYFEIAFFIFIILSYKKAASFMVRYLDDRSAKIKAELDADSEDFFKRVMQQADQQQHAGMR